MEWWSFRGLEFWSDGGLEFWRDVERSDILAVGGIERSSQPRPFGEIPLKRGSIGKVK